MYPGIPQIISLQISTDRHWTPCDNLEDYAMKYGRVIKEITWSDRLFLSIGKMLIRLGYKMTRVSTRHYKLSEETL
jgi:hypothetical protein